MTDAKVPSNGTAPTRTKAEIDADVAKTLAETRKIDAEAQAAVAAVRKTDAETRKADAEALVAELEAQDCDARLVKTVHDRDREIEKRKKELAADEHHHVYHFKGQVDAGSADKCLEQLNLWRRTEAPGEVEIVFFSPGGSVLAGMALFDFITAMRTDGWTFTTNCRGYAASMAGILLQAGDVRICGPESYILIHEVSSAAVGKIGELEDEVEFVRMIQDRVLDIFVKRSGGKVTKAKLKSKFRRKDFWLSSDEALRLGIIDEIR